MRTLHQNTLTITLILLMGLTIGCSEAEFSSTGTAEKVGANNINGDNTTTTTDVNPNDPNDPNDPGKDPNPDPSPNPSPQPGGDHAKCPNRSRGHDYVDEVDSDKKENQDRLAKKHGCSTVGDKSGNKNQKVMICHVNPSHSQELCLPLSAMNGHMKATNGASETSDEHKGHTDDYYGFCDDE